MRINTKRHPLVMGGGDSLIRTLCALTGRGLLFTITAIPTVAIVFMIIFIAGEAVPFFKNISNIFEFFTGTTWTPSAVSPHFGALAIFYGTAMVTIGSCIVAIPVGIVAAICLNEIVSASSAKFLKPALELLAAIPSVVYGFFAIVVFAPLLQDHGGVLISVSVLFIGVPSSILAGICIGELWGIKIFGEKRNGYIKKLQYAISTLLLASVFILAYFSLSINISSGTNAFNASVILAIMALPTIVSISQDALSSVGRDMREGSLALGATRAETIFKVLLPCAKSGIAVAVILGLMRVVGETMVVWMASGNALKIPEPFFNFFEPVRTLTATIAGEMGEADQSTGSDRYHVLFAMSFCLLMAALVFNAVGQWFGRSIKK